MGAFCNNLFGDTTINQPLIRPIIGDSPQAQPPLVAIPQANLKGKSVIAADSNLAGREEALKANRASGDMPVGQGPSKFVSFIPPNQDKVEIVYEGKKFLMDRDFWGKVCSQALEPMDPHQAGPSAAQSIFLEPPWSLSQPKTPRSPSPSPALPKSLSPHPLWLLLHALRESSGEGGNQQQDPSPTSLSTTAWWLSAEVMPQRSRSVSHLPLLPLTLLIP